MPQPTAAEIADRLVRLRDRLAPRKKTKSLFITKAQFNRLAGRSKIEEAILVPVCRQLRRSQLQLVRLEGGFALLDGGTIGAWLQPGNSDLRIFAREPLPAAAWPFPTGSKP